MECDLCGRPVIVEHVGDKPKEVHCVPCADHVAKRCLPAKCGACLIVALSGFSIKEVRKLTADELLATLWYFEKGAIVWRSFDGRQLVVISPDAANEPYGLLVDASGWCKRSKHG